MPKRINGWYGWSPDKPDIRDRYRLERPRATPMPDAVDLRDKLPPCWDQGDLGSCTAHAIGGALVFDQTKQGLQPLMPSRLFIYYNERAMEGTIGEDAGAEIRDGIKSVAKQGAPAEKLWPYNISRFTSKPTKRVYTAARRHCALRYERILQNLDSMKRCLADGFPFVFGFSVYEQFESPEVERTGIVNLPSNSDGMVGGHAVLAVGYDQAARRFLVRNSWNTDWGMEGYFTIPYDYLINRDLADDFWVIRLIK